ncbi:MAG: hypothetical protein IIT58_07080 [Treponema sp.]|nr:hypothetical protein [Treponema sp.]
MAYNERGSKRFDDIGRFEAPEICALPASLENISKTGCKVQFKLPVTLDMDNEYEAKITFARAAAEGALVLLCKPQWMKEDAGVTEIGFEILPSRDFTRLAEYVSQLHLEESDSIEDQISDSSCQII